MIPKTIHYCWFGKGEMPSLANKCILSWKKYLPDYNLKLWNEDSFDLDSVQYVKEAYLAKKYAFVTDYVRLYALFHEGGIYMDTDVEILKSLNDLLNLPAFSGYESNKYSNFPTGLMASKKNGLWVTEQLSVYDNLSFIKSDGSYDLTTNTERISHIMIANGFQLNGDYQVYKNDMYCFPKDYFCPKTSSGLIKITKNTYCIHHFAGSWVEENFRQKFKRIFFNKILGPIITDKVVNLKRLFLSKIQATK
jgi:hypothetical protein